MDIEAAMGRPVSVQIRRKIAENRKSVTLTFDAPFRRFQPGQFVMTWIPGFDEIPMSISYWKPPEAGITVLPIGDATRALASLSEGNLVGIRGPFGRGFKGRNDRAIVVGGGIGTAPLRPLVYSFIESKNRTTVIVGAREKGDLLFADEFASLARNGIRLILSTDDGSAGFKGLATQAAEQLMQTETFDSVYTCGPELMMAGLYRLALKHKAHIQASLERFMKCGCGLCGTCALDSQGELVCVDGPVFTGRELAKIDEFGVYRRNTVGSKCRL
jgi:dihydroorotate dehydrogenase electron transfer subunit